MSHRHLAYLTAILGSAALLSGCASNPQVKLEQVPAVSLSGAPVTYLHAENLRLTVGTLKPLQAKFSETRPGPVAVDGWGLFWFNPSRMLESYVFEPFLPSDELIFERYLVENATSKTGFKRGNRKVFAWNLMICPPGAQDPKACGLVTQLELFRETVYQNKLRVDGLSGFQGFKVVSEANYQSKVAEMRRLESVARAANAERERVEGIKAEQARARLKEETKYVEDFIKRAKAGSTLPCEANNGSTSLRCSYSFKTEWPHFQNMEALLQNGWSIASQVNIPQTDIHGETFVKSRYVFQKR